MPRNLIQPTKNASTTEPLLRFGRFFYGEIMNLYKKYTNEDIEFIKKNYRSMTYQQIAECLGRTKNAIRHKSHELGLSKNDYIFGIDKVEGEVWKPIKGYEGKYCVSNMGRIMSVERSINGGGKIKQRIMKQCNTRKGYKTVCLYSDGKRIRNIVHRLVAEAFIPNPNNYNQVNHIDENKSNNAAHNLEWCTAKQNMNYGSRAEKSRKKAQKKVLKVDKFGNVVDIYSCAEEAANANGIGRREIAKFCRGNRVGLYHGYYWKYDAPVGRRNIPIVMLDLSGKFIRKYKSVVEAANDLNVNSYQIYQNAAGNAKTAYGYIFVREENYENI